MIYTATPATDGRIIALCRGSEIGVADNYNAAAMLCARDAIDADPEATPDVVYDVAADIGQMVDNVKHMTWFRKAVAEAIRDEWEV